MLDNMVISLLRILKAHTKVIYIILVKGEFSDEENNIKNKALAKGDITQISVNNIRKGSLGSLRILFHIVVCIK